MEIDISPKMAPAQIHATFIVVPRFNITTLITATILYALGSGPVRGFAITLGLGILTSVFSAIFVTRLLIVWWFSRRRPKTIEV